MTSSSTSTTSSTTAAPATSQIVTLPHIPELFDPNFLDVLVPAPLTIPKPKGTVVAEAPSNALLDALRSIAHHKLTANTNAPTFSSTLSPTLDAYLGLRTGISGQEIDRYLEEAWAKDPNLTLRIIWSTRSIHDGKGEKELFYRAFGWLFENHPRTAITNLHYLVESSSKVTEPHGTWKDLLNILALATLDKLTPKVPLNPPSNSLHNNFRHGTSRPVFQSSKEHEEWFRAQHVDKSRRAHDRLTQKLLDKRYRALYIAVARLFGDRLAKESDLINKIAALPADADQNDQNALLLGLTLISKWAPTPGGAHDRTTNISSAISLLLHDARVSFPGTPNIPLDTTMVSAPDMHLLRRLYQKYILTRGRRYICIPEPLMSSNRWSEIPYSRVSSVCMNKNKDNFFTHDEDRFMRYLQDVESGKSNISGATLLPHVLATEAVILYRRQTKLATRRLSSDLRVRERQRVEAQMRVVEAQWATLVARLRESGQLDNCIAVCDISGSMGSSNRTPKGKSPFNVDPFWPAISLSLLVARLAKPPFNDLFIAFTTSPQFVTVEPESSRVPLGATIEGIADKGWWSHDCDAVFHKLILPLAIKHKVPQDQMIKRFFVFSNMQFDKTSTQDSESPADWKTFHDVIAEAYTNAGYNVPELVYWDLSNPRSGDHGITPPVTEEREGVALLSGYSPSSLKLFMDREKVDDQLRSGKTSLTPDEWMKKALGRKSYDGLTVVD